MRKTVVKEWLELALKYAAVGTLVFSVFTYFENLSLENRRAAAAKSEAYISDYTSGKMLEYDQFIAMFWRKIPAVVRQASSLSENDASRVFQKLVLANPQYADYENALNHILLHFDLVTFCSKQGLCEGDIVDAFYCSEYRSLRPIFDLSLSYYKKEGISTGARAKEYFDEKCDQRSFDIGSRKP
jgi:hypothetical protein